MANFKENDLEMVGSDLSVSAHFLADQVSRPSQVVNEAYIAQKDTYLSDSVEKAKCKSKVCTTPDATRYQFFFNDNVSQNDVMRENWTPEQKAHYADPVNKEHLWSTCDFQCEVNGRAVFPVIL